MRPKSILLLALALGCGLIASWGISDVMERNAKGKNTPAVETEPIYVAIKDINVNEALTPEMVRQEEWPKEKLPHDALRVLDELVGQRAGAKIYADEPIRASRLVPPNQSAATQLPMGYRPFPVRVSAESSAAGLIKPGDHVDVQLFVKRNPALGIEETRTQTIMSNLRVFAVDQVFDRATEDKEAHIIASTISLVVTTEQANKLSLAGRVGEMNLMLRHPEDEGKADDSTSVSDLFKLEEGDAEAERENPSTASDILKKLQEMKNAAAGHVAAEETPVPVTPVVDIAPAHQMMVLRGNEIEVVEFPTDGSLPSNMPAAKASPTQPTSIQNNSAPIINPPATTNSDEPVQQPPLQETSADSVSPADLENISNLDLGTE